MPFVRFSRDRRGYEHTYLIHATDRKGAPARILYWYRTPPGIRVGRAAFDEELRRTLEAEYPSVSFDWQQILESPMPAPEVEPWRERRRAAKAARQGREAGQRDDAPAVEPAQAESIPPAAPLAALEATPAVASGDEEEQASHRRRRRGGRRHRKGGGAPAAVSGPAEAPPAETPEPAENGPTSS